MQAATEPAPSAPHAGPAPPSTPPAAAPTVAKAQLSALSTISAPAAGKERFLVVDTAAFIRGVNLERFGSTLCTTPEVLAEIKDPVTRQRIAAFPVPVQQKEPTPDDVRAIQAFAKKTGDLAFLSATDVRVLALTYMLHRQLDGVADLRTEPKAITAAPPKHARAEPGARGRGGDRGRGGAERGGWGPSRGGAQGSRGGGEGGRGRGGGEGGRGRGGGEGGRGRGGGRGGKAAARGGKPAAAVTSAECEHPHAPAPGAANAAPAAPAAVAMAPAPAEPVAASAPPPAPVPAPVASPAPLAPPPAAASPTATATAIAATEKAAPVVPTATATATAPAEADSDSDSDEDGWITPDNIAEVSAGAAGPDAGVAAPTSHVACMTADFAMQNTLLQMGLAALSVEGLAIKRAHQWALQCHGCFTVVRDTAKLFCPNCGHNTLLKVSLRVDAQGRVTTRQLRRQVSTKGTRFAMPLPKGGRTETKIVTAEDQLPRRRERDADASHPDHLFFASRAPDTHGPKFLVAGKEGPRKNPNQARRKKR